jgi:transmembrane sensor
MFRTVSSVWESPDLREAAAAAATAQPSLFNAKIRFRRRWPIPAVTAACILLLAIIGLRFAVDGRLQADYQTGAGERRTVELPDRSIATLNTHSAIALSFDDTARRVRLLSGEAFFNVRHDATRPFIVEGSEAAVRAVGTAFVVRAEPDGARVTVVEGTVEVGANRAHDPPVVVTAGSQLRMKHGHSGRPYAVDVAEASAWLRGRLVVNGVPFEEVLEELRRYYPGTIVLWNRDVGNIQVTGTYNVNDPVGALALLIKTIPVSAIGLTDRLVILF